MLGFVDDTVRRVRLFSPSITNKHNNTLIHQNVQLIGPHKRAETKRERESVSVFYPNNITKIYSFQSTIERETRLTRRKVKRRRM